MAKEAEAAFAHSRTLSRELEQSPELFPARWGLWLFYWGRGALKAADEIANEMVSGAGIGSDTGLLLQTHHAAWATCYSRGELQSALQHTSEGLGSMNRPGTPQWQTLMAIMTQEYAA